MKAETFIKHLNETYGNHTIWPDSIEVDADTYANCCQHVFTRLEPFGSSVDIQYNYYEIKLGNRKGLMFKNIELILKR